MIRKRGAAQYLVRFDDICPTMNWAIWERVEAELERYSIKPLLAVIPDNKDPALFFSPPYLDFWEKIREWQSRGYSIALHGFQHKYVNNNPGILRLSHNSEFADLPEAEQEQKILSALAVFRRNGVNADAWIAPSHSFDPVTVKLLKKHGIDVISDGLCRLPWTDEHGITWVPQQLWDFKHKTSGVWTVCYHHNNWPEDFVSNFSASLQAYSDKITNLNNVLDEYKSRRLTLTDRVSCELYWQWHFGTIVRALRIRTFGSAIKQMIAQAFR